MKTFEKTLTVMPDDLDELDHVNNVRYVQWIQDISKEHWIAGASEKIRNKVVWVVMNHNISYKGAAKINDQIRVSTHIDGSHGATCVRIVEMHNIITNQLLLRSKTDWCLLTAKTLKPTRISEEIKSVFS